MSQTTHRADPHHNAREEGEAKHTEKKGAAIPLRWVVTPDTATLQFDAAGDGTGWATIPQVSLEEAEAARAAKAKDDDATHH